MAFSFLPTTIVPEDDTQVRTGVCSEAITQGRVIRKASDGRLFIADAELATEDTVEGIALSTTTASGQPLVYAPPGTFVVVSGLTAGQAYYLGGAADEGKVGLFADALAGTHFASLVGLAYTAARFRIIGYNTDQQL